MMPADSSREPTTYYPSRPAPDRHGGPAYRAVGSVTDRSEVGCEIGIDAVRGAMACQNLIVDSYRRADAGNRQAMAELIEQDGSLAVDDAIVTGREAIREMLAARDADPDRRTMHVVANLIFDRLAEDSMKVRYVLIVFLLSASGSPAFVPNSLASVLDTLARRADRCWLTNRTITTAPGGR